MSNENDVNVRIGAETSTLRPGLDQAAQAVQSATDRMRTTLSDMSGHVDKVKGSFDGLAAPITKLTALWATLAATVAGAAFSAGINESKKLTGEATRLAAALGITTDEASALNTALGDVGTDSDTYLSALQQFERQLKKNEDGMKAMGLQTRDSSGNLRDARTLMSEAGAVVGSYKQGVDQSAAAMTFFGRSTEDAMKIMKLNQRVLDEAKTKNEELGLTITENNVKATKAYKAAMNDLDDVMSGIRKTIGDAVMPVFTDLANWLSSVGPSVVAGFRVAIQSLVVVFRMAEGAVRILYTWFVDAFAGMRDLALDFGNVMSHVLKWEFDEALEAAKTGWNNYKGHVSQTWDDIVAEAQAANDKIAAAVTPDTSPGVRAGASTGSKTMGNLNPGTEPKSRMPAFEETLNRMKEGWMAANVAEQHFLQWSEAQNASYWRGILEGTKLTDTERRAVMAKYVQAAEAAQKQEFEQQLASLREQAAAVQHNYAERIRLAEEAAAMVGRAYGRESTQFAQAQIEITRLKREQVAQQRRIDEEQASLGDDILMESIKAQEDAVELSRSLRLMSNAEALAATADFERKRFAIQYAAMQRRIELEKSNPDADPVALNKALADIERLQMQHGERLRGIQRQQTQEANAFTMQMASASESWLSQTFQRMGTSMGKFGESFRASMLSLGQLFLRMASDMAAKWIVTEALKTTATTTGAAARTAAEVSSAATSTAVQSAAGSKSIMMDAYEAMAGAYKAIVGIPYVGPFLAPAAAATAFAAVAALAGRMFSAEGGFDIPAGVNPVTQLHQREMVLPAKYADVIRGMADGGGGGGGDTHNWHIQALDGDSVRRVLMDNAGHVFDAAKAAARGGRR